MYAIVECGGKQYRVTPGDVITVEQLREEVGREVSLDRVLLVGDEEAIRVGKPNCLFVAYQQYPVQRYFPAYFFPELFHGNHVSGSYPVLFTTTFHNRVH